MRATSPTVRASQFMLANDKSPVVEGEAKRQGGGVWILRDGQSFDLSLADMRSLPGDYPKWDFSKL